MTTESRFLAAMSRSQLYYSDSSCCNVLNSGVVHVWLASLKQSESCFNYLFQTLSPDECMRAEKFVFHKDRRKFIICRGILRNIISRYLCCSASDIQFSYELNGKPAIIDYQGNHSIYFNLSHSKDLALFAFSTNQEIGVDLEYIRSLPDIEQISELIFTTREMEVLRGISSDKKQSAFYKAWTRKEALSKALGKGLSMPLNKVEALLSDEDKSISLFVEEELKHISKWFVYDLDPAVNYAGALTVNKPCFDISFRQWELISRIEHLEQKRPDMRHRVNHPFNLLK